MNCHGNHYLSYNQNTLFKSSHIAYQIKGNGTYSNIQAHILSLHTPSAPGVRSKGQTFLSEISHVAYQTKWNGA